MESIKELYKIRRGPSSSHTIGPERAAKIMMERYPTADFFEVELLGSLAFTGKGHRTDFVLQKTFNVDCKVVFNTELKELMHPNTFIIRAYKDNQLLASLTFYSIGGGSLQIEGEEKTPKDEIYSEKNMKEIISWCHLNNCSFADYVFTHEKALIKNHLSKVYEKMNESIERGLHKQGTLPGKLHIQRKAKRIYNSRIHGEENYNLKTIASYALAVAEENASGEQVVTAPTCGSSGVLPAILRFAKEKYHFSQEKIIESLAVAGIFGNVVKTNASISGAECGCQAELGTACAMASTALAYLFDLSLEQIEYVAEMALEHNLGLTCDPLEGMVQIPCIERNVIIALRVLDLVELAKLFTNSHKISFDMVVQTMKETGMDLSYKYRETAEGGLARLKDKII